MKKLVLILFLSLVPHGANATDWCANENEGKYTPIETRYKKGLMFEVKKCGLEVNHILGTMHSDDPKLVEMLDFAFAKLIYSRSANFEIKFDEEQIRTTVNAMYYPPDSVETLQDVVDAETYTKFVKIMTRLQPANPQTNYYRMRPWAAAVLMQEPPNKTDGVALDIKLQKFAQGRNMRVFGLETAAEQLAVFQNIPKQKQVEFFRDTVWNFEQLEKSNQELFDTYMAQDLKKLEKLGDQAFDNMPDREFAEKLKFELVDKRNRKMVKGMEARLNEGGAFIAVGALHLPGKVGILKLLEEKGYFIDVMEDPDSVMAQ